MTLPRHRNSPTRADFAALLELAAPIVLIQVGMMLMGVVDTIMVGNVSAAALAAVALGHFFFFVVTMFGMGVLFALDPIIAQALGAKDPLAVTRGLQRGLVLSVVLAVPTSLLLFAVEPVLTLVRQPAEIIPVAAGYVHRLIPSVWPLYAFVVLRQTLQAHHRTAPMVATIIVANLLNAGLNYVWVFGRARFPGARRIRLGVGDDREPLVHGGDAARARLAARCALSAEARARFARGGSARPHSVAWRPRSARR